MNLVGNLSSRYEAKFQHWHDPSFVTPQRSSKTSFALAASLRWLNARETLKFRKINRTIRREADSSLLSDSCSSGFFKQVFRTAEFASVTCTLAVNKSNCSALIRPLVGLVLLQITFLSHVYTFAIPLRKWAEGYYRFEVFCCQSKFTPPCKNWLCAKYQQVYDAIMHQLSFVWQSCRGLMSDWVIFSVGK